ncbi:PST family polysaccharide transporter [Streptosporangium album]|uniref:PST family polysaccharide transporter n=1 Tax=Streptosporangium album TaxID=47479 RepID=A0A7W7RVL8_9ACTN|nr:oligosaccharide flippase family protein [Streptosporangium album]MBB4939064.1 PST family polysaccharide transporter [Streptosporangium album]
MEDRQGADPAAVDEETGRPDAAASQVGEIGRQAGRGLRWSVLGNLVMRAGSFAVSLVLARLLVPEDFGVYAIAMAASQFVIHINDAGIIAATVQWRGKLEDMAPTATIVAIASSTALYGVFWVIAPYFAHASGSEDATWVIRVLSATNLVYGLTAVRSAALLRRFEQDKLTKANLVGFLVNAPVSIVLAAGGAGAFSFAWGQLCGAAVTAVLVVAYARVRIKFGMNRAIARKLLVFGLPLCVSLGIEGLLLNADYVIVGDVLGLTLLGFYLLAFNISSWVPGLIGTAVRYVALPSFSRLAEENEESLSLGVQRAVPLLFSIVVPVAVLMGTLAPAVVVFLYGERWAPSAEVLRFLAILMVVRMLTALAFDILAAMGATRATVWLNLGWAVALVPALMVGARVDGIRGAAVGHAVVAVLVALPLATLALHRAGVVLAPIAAALARPVLGGVLAAVVMTALVQVVGGVPLVQLCVAGGTGLLGYVLVVVPQAVLKQLGGRVTDLIPARSR